MNERTDRITPAAASDCPSWCRADHARDGHVHRVEVGRANVGDGTAGERVPVVLLQVPGAEPTVTISGGLYVAVQLDDADDMARLMDMAGQCDMAALIRRAAGILQADDEQGARDDAPGDVGDAEVRERAARRATWPGGEVASVRDAADREAADRDGADEGQDRDECEQDKAPSGRVRRVAESVVAQMDRCAALARDLRADGDTDLADAFTGLADAWGAFTDGGDIDEAAARVVAANDRARAALTAARARQAGGTVGA